MCSGAWTSQTSAASSLQVPMSVSVVYSSSITLHQCKYFQVKMVQGKTGCIWCSCSQEILPCCAGILASPRSQLLWHLCTCGPPQFHPHSPCPCCLLQHGTPLDRYQGSIPKQWTHLWWDHLHASTTWLYLCHTPKPHLLPSQDPVWTEAEWLMLVPEAH